MRTGSCMIEGEDDHLPALNGHASRMTTGEHERTPQFGDPGSERNKAAHDG
jgi:hypothetical protein